MTTSPFRPNERPVLVERLLKIARDLQRYGVALYPGFLSGEEAQILRIATLHTLLSARPDSQYHEGGYVQHRRTGPSGIDVPALLFWPAVINQTFDLLRTDPRMVELVRTLLGAEVKQANNQLYFRQPGDGDEFGFHRDLMFRDPHPDIGGSYVQTAILIDPMNKTNGGIEFLMGSHRVAGDLPSMESLRRYDAGVLSCGLGACQRWVASGDPGDLILWSPMTVHGSQPNRHQYMSRMYVMNGFCTSETTPSWPPYLVKGQPVALDASCIPKRNP